MILKKKKQRLTCEENKRKSMSNHMLTDKF